MSNRTFLSGKFLTAFLMGIFVLGTAFVAGCKKESSPTTATTIDQSVNTTDDVADAVADGLASNNGGAMDQVNDAFEIAGGVGVGAEALGKSYSDSTSVQKVYDSTTVSWSTYIYKQKTGLQSFGIWSRTYWHQFWGNGKPQKFRTVGGVVADSIKHQIKGGAGYFWTPRLTHRLTSISGDWSVTNADTVTINGTYKRSGIDTIKVTARKGRVLVDTLSLTFINVKGPRGLRRERSAGTSGTIIGKYTALVTVTGRTPFYIEKEFTITLGGGSATFSIDGTSYKRDLASGDPI